MTLPSLFRPATRMLAVLAMLSAMAAPATANAQENLIYKCVDATGKVSIQSDSCPKGSTTTWRRPAPSEPALTASQQAQAEAKILRDQQTVRELSEVVDRKLKEASSPSPPPSDVPVTAAPAGAPPIAVDPCRVAQSFANSVREKTWLGLTDDQVRRLYGWVAEQCKVQPAIDD